MNATPTDVGAIGAGLAGLACAALDRPLLEGASSVTGDGYVSLPLLLNAFATFAMTGLIWFVQIVHYPLFRAVGASGYASYQEQHMRLTTLVVGPLMLLEGATALWLVLRRPATVSPATAWTGLVLLAVAWLVTALFSVPRHQTLRRSFDASAHAGLVATNWVRTAAWTARSVLLLFALVTHR